MKIINEVEELFIQAKVKLFKAIESTDNEGDLFLNGNNSVADLLEFISINQIKYAFYNYSEVTEDSLIDLEGLTEEFYGHEAIRFRKEAKLYNDLVKRHLGELLSCSIFVVHNGLQVAALVEGEIEIDIEEDGEIALNYLTRDYLEQEELYKLEREQDLLNEIEEEKEKEKKAKINKFYSLLERDKSLPELKTKEGRILRATELAIEVGLKETKTSIVGHLDVFSSKKKRRSD